MDSEKSFMRNLFGSFEKTLSPGAGQPETPPPAGGCACGPWCCCRFHQPRTPALRYRETREGGPGVVRRSPRSSPWTAAPTSHSHFLRIPCPPTFRLQCPDLAMARTDIRVTFRVKAVPVSSCTIQSVSRPVKNGMAISPGEEKK